MAFRRELYGHLLFGKTNVNFEESYKFSLFSSVFRSMLIISIGVLFSNLLPSCFISETDSNKRFATLLHWHNNKLTDKFDFILMKTKNRTFFSLNASKGEFFKGCWLVYFCTTYYEISQFVSSIYHSNDIFEVCFITSLASFSEVCARLCCF